MTSSVLDGVGDMQSPAPPAFSPLTDPAPDSWNREPSVHDTTMLDQPQDSENNHNNASAAETATSSLPQILNNNHSTTMDPDLDVEMQDGNAPPIIPQPMDFNLEAMDLYQQSTTAASILNLMTLARMSTTAHQTQMHQPPSTIRPSQVTMRAALDSMMGTPDPLVAPPPVPPPAATAETPLESFAKIEFADSVFQMTTYSVIIGRDQRAMKQAQRDEKRQKEYERRIQECQALGLPLPSPPRQIVNKFSKSYVSEEGGMLGPESDGDSEYRPNKRRRLSAAASASGDMQEQRRLGAAAAEQMASGDKNNMLDRQYVSHTPGAVPVNLSALMPSPDYCPFIGIHSPGPNIAAKTKGISREHMKIEYDQKEGVFKAIPLHRNGFFIEDVHHKDEPVVLKSGTHIQIKDVELTFIINGVPLGKTGREGKTEEQPKNNRRYSEGGKEMSFDFEDSRDVDRRSTTPEETAGDEEIKEDSDSELSELEDDIVEPMDEGGDHDVMETIEQDSDKEDQPQQYKPEDLAGMTPEMLAAMGPIVPKKRGPGRPPKNGIMSKREERLRKKAAMELAKKNMPAPTPGEPTQKRKVGRPRKHPLPEDNPDRPEKRKYKPRKLKSGEEGEEISEGEKAARERRREKPKTPPLVLRREDYTEEQLAKPSKNYGILIDEVLSTVAPDGLSLKQIYKRIQIAYPHYYFCVDSKGWESSVRHNLIGNDAFQKNIETHLWHRVPGIDIDAGKKRKAVSPDHSASHHTFAQHSQTPTGPPGHMFHAETGTQQGIRPGTVPQRPGYPAAHGQVNLGQHPHQHLSGQPATAGVQQAPQRPAYPTAPQQQGSAQAAASYGEQAAAAARQLPQNPQTQGYSSPYSSRPPPGAAGHQPAGMPQTAARQGSQPHAGPSPYNNGVPRVNSATPVPGAPAAARPGQQLPATNGAPIPLKPVVPPELASHIALFKQTTTATLFEKALQGQMQEVEILVMSVIARGLKLSTESLIPDRESIEKIVLGVFENSIKSKFGEAGKLHPDLIKELVGLRTRVTSVLSPKMGSKLAAERLVLSATTRVLGFADKSWMPGSDKYGHSENLLMNNIETVILTHQKTLAGLGTTPAPGPVSHPPASNPRAPMGTAGPTYPAVQPSHPSTVARPSLAPGQPVNAAAAQRPLPASQASAPQAPQQTPRGAWASGAAAPPQMQGSAAASARPMAPIAPHPLGPAGQQAGPARTTMTPATPTMYSPTPHALAQSLAAKSQAAAAAQGAQPVQNQATRVQAPTAQVSQPSPAQSTAQTGTSTSSPQTAVQQTAVQPGAPAAARTGTHQPMQAHNTAHTASQATPTHFASSSVPPQRSTQSISPTAARTGAPQTGPTPTGQPQPVAQTAPRQSVPTTQPVAPSPAPAIAQTAAPTTSTQTAPQVLSGQTVSQPSAQISSKPSASIQSQVQSPTPPVPRVSGPAGLPPKPMVAAPGLAPMSPSVSQSPTVTPNLATSSPKPAAASPVPATARTPSTHEQQQKPVVQPVSQANTQTAAQSPHHQSIARPPSANGEGQPGAHLPSQIPAQNPHQHTAPAPISPTTAQVHGQSTVTAASTLTPPQTAARPPTTTAAQGQVQVQGQQINNVSQAASTLANGIPTMTHNQAGSTSKPPMTPAAAMTTPVSAPAQHAPTNPAQTPAPTAAATAAR